MGAAGSKANVQPRTKGVVAATSPGSIAAPEGHDAASALKPDDPKLVAAAVHASGNSKLQAAWETLKVEFQVQLSIWDSLSMSRDSLSMARKELQKSAEAAMAKAEKDAVGATKLLVPLLERAGKEGLLNSSTEAAAQAVIKMERRVQGCKKLAERILGPLQEGEPAQSESAALLQRCRLEVALEKRVRKALHMAPTKEELAAAARKEKDAQARAEQAKAKQVADAAKVTLERAKKAIDRAGGDADLALVMLLSEGDSKKQQKALQAEQDQKAAKAALQARASEAEEVARLVSNLAASTQQMAWAKVRSEIQVQISVWESQAVVGRNWDYSEAKEQLEGTLATARADPAGAGMILEMVLADFAEQGVELCAGMLDAADAVLDAERATRSRRGLTSSLEATAAALKAGAQPQWTASELQEMIKVFDACLLGSSTLSYRVRQVLDEKTHLGRVEAL